MIRLDDAVIMIAYFALPLQILTAFYRYPHRTSVSWRICLVILLLCCGLVLCGLGHTFRCLGLTGTSAYSYVNYITSIVSLALTLSLIPTIPALLSSLDKSLQSTKTLNEELESSKRQMITFMAFLCHEIRNPLFVITTNVTFLEDADVKDGHSQEEALQSISQSADLMLRLVNDVLDISKLEAGNIDLQEENFDLRATLEGVARTMEHFVQQNHNGAVLMRTKIEDNLPRSVRTDGARLLQIVYNLLSNANKFTEEGHISFLISIAPPEELEFHGINRKPIRPVGDPNRVHALVTADDDDPGNEGDVAMSLLRGLESGESNSYRDERQETQDPWIYLRIRVQDTGIGISPEKLDYLFQPYSQSKLASYRSQGGTGLGVAIVSKLCALLGGKLCVTSTVGVGTTFDAFISVQIPELDASSGELE